MSALAGLLRAVYLLFAVAAGGRCLAQWLEDPGRAPLAYALSTVAFGCYLAGFVALVRTTSSARATTSRRGLAVIARVELAGVLLVGTLSLVAPALFAEPTVWSWYGAGYGFLPLLIPLGLLHWLRRCAGPVAGRAPAPSVTPPRPAAHSRRG